MGKQKIELGPGTILVAPPMGHEDNFFRTVVLVCEHGEDGSFGLILSRPLPVDISDIVEGLDGLKGKDLVSMGGPVQNNSLHYLHRFEQKISDAVEVIPSV